ncbi:MAG: hypothetical protein WED01_09485 [Candidatus Rokuibacteriota bacterium]
MRTLVILIAFVLMLGGVPGRAAAAPPSTPEEIVAEVRRATARYLDIERAREDGFVQISGMVLRHGYHFLNASSPLLSSAWDALTGAIDLARPPMLLYLERDGQWQLAGVEYALPRKPDPNPLPGADWHEHEASCHYRDFREVPASSARACPPVHPVSGERFVLWHPAMAVAHVWAWYPNPAGPFAEENAYLAPYGGAVHQEGHAHARNPAEAVISQFTHRASGALLLVLAALIVWEGRPGRRFPWNAFSATLWVVFGTYVFFGADPEAWPLGPKPFVEIFLDPLVLQHKLLALLLVVIGAIEGLRAYGAVRTRYLVPVLGAVGGASLLVHFHDNAIHFDAIYLQHAIMGLTAVALGATLFFVRRAAAERLMTWAWPAFLLVMGTVLIFYVER